MKVLYLRKELLVSHRRGLLLSFYLIFYGANQTLNKDSSNIVLYYICLVSNLCWVLPAKFTQYGGGVRGGAGEVEQPHDGVTLGQHPVKVRQILDEMMNVRWHWAEVSYHYFRLQCHTSSHSQAAEESELKHIFQTKIFFPAQWKFDPESGGRNVPVWSMSHDHYSC